MSSTEVKRRAKVAMALRAACMQFASIRGESIQILGRDATYDLITSFLAKSEN